MVRALKPGGRAIILEFSHPVAPGLKPIYDLYSFTVLPALGKLVANDAASYRYLAESIRMHPDQETLLHMMEAVGFERCGEAPSAPVYEDGQKTVTLKGDNIAAEFKVIIERYVQRTYKKKLQA